MKKLLLLALLLMPTMTLARVASPIELPPQVAPIERPTPIVEPTPEPSVGGGGGGNLMAYLPHVTSPIINQATTYQFLTGQFGFAYFESITGERIYEMDYCTYHTIDTKGAGTIYFVQIDKNGYQHPVLKVLDIE